MSGVGIGGGNGIGIDIGGGDGGGGSGSGSSGLPSKRRVVNPSNVWVLIDIEQETSYT